MSRGPKRILFVMRNPVYLRNFESTIALLASRRHRVHVAFEGSKARVEDEDAIIADLAAGYPNVTWDSAPKGDTRWLRFSRRLRMARNHLRYLEPRYRDATKLRARAARHSPRLMRLFAASPLARSFMVRRQLDRGLAALDAALPVSPKLRSFLRRRPVDLVLVTPLMHFDSHQVDYLRAARSLGIPTGLPVFSWDNLTNKGLMHANPDHVWVWNERQRREAIELHGIEPDRVEVTGSPAYDVWFDREPSEDRAAFCRRLGLPAQRPYLLWLCSSAFIAPEEVTFVRRWIGELRRRGGITGDAAVLVRPHPMNVDEWRSDPLADLDAVVVHPREGADPRDDASRREYFDALYHAAAVVGINTSALIESAIAGRAVHTIRAPEFRETQDGTLHFRHLVEAGGGLLNVADDFDEHWSQLEHTLLDPAAAAERNATFLREFVRPDGLDAAATPRLVEAIERALQPAAEAQKVEPLFDRALEAAGRVTAPLGVGLFAHANTERPLPEDMAPEEALAWAEHEIAGIAASGGPVIAGPWTSEVGFELLYWIPLLRRAVESHPGLAERLTVVSRGGAGAWYEGIANRYVDVFDLISPEELAARREQGKQKQLRLEDWEQALLERAAEHAGVSGAAVLPPSVLYSSLQHLVISDAGPHIRHISRYATLHAPAEPELTGVLPADYVAVRFYFSLAFPASEENRRFVARAVSSLAERTHVVLLNTGFSVDDHVDADPALSERLVRLSDHMTLTDNLAVQTQAVAGARAFVGTYGGLAYLPCFLGVRSLGFYSGRGKFNPWHVHVAQRVFAGKSYGDFMVVNADHMDLVGALVGSNGGFKL